MPLNNVSTAFLSAFSGVLWARKRQVQLSVILVFFVQLDATRPAETFKSGAAQ